MGRPFDDGMAGRERRSVGEEMDRDELRSRREELGRHQLGAIVDLQRRKQPRSRAGLGTGAPCRCGQ